MEVLHSYGFLWNRHVRHGRDEIIVSQPGSANYRRILVETDVELLMPKRGTRLHML